MGIGAHLYYRLVVDTVYLQGGTTFNIHSAIPLISELAPTPGLTPDGLGYWQGWPLENHSVILRVGSSNVIKTASANSTGWNNVTPGTFTFSNWTNSVLGSWGSLQFPEPYEVNYWSISSYGYGQGTTYRAITGMSFYYSDNGTDWSLARSYSDVTNGLFPANNCHRTFMMNASSPIFPLRRAFNRSSLPAAIGYTSALPNRSSLAGFVYTKALPNRSTLVNSPPSQLKASLGDLQWRLSGGSANTDPAASLGGDISLQTIASQIPTFLDTPAGVTLVAASNNVRGIGTLKLIFGPDGSKWLEWTPSGELEGGAVQIRFDGRFTLPAGRGTDYGYLSVDVDFSALPAEEGRWRVHIDNSDQALFPDVPQSEAGAGSSKYRCAYLYNASATGTLRDFFLFQRFDTYSATDIEVGIDPAGVTLGTGAVTIVDEDTPPAGVTFSQPAFDDPILLGANILPGRSLPIWIKRTVPAHTYRSVQHDLSSLMFGVRF